MERRLGIGVVGSLRRLGLMVLLLLSVNVMPSLVSPALAGRDAGKEAPVANSTALTSPALIPVALGIYQKLFPNDLAELTEYESRAGQKMSIVHWYTTWGGWKSTFSASDLEAVAARGSIPMITWEPWAGPGFPGDHGDWSLRNAILSGKHDAYITSWAQGLAAYGRPVMLRFAHEMHHQPAYSWAVGVNGNTAEDYVAAWKRVHGIFARYNTHNVKWVWNPNTLGDAPVTAYGPIYRSLYPGDEYVDWVGLDIFNTGPDLDWGAPYWRTLGQVLSEPYQAITQLTRKPLILAEVGCTERGGSKADWISSSLTASLPVQFPQVRALVWFDVNKEHEQAWQLKSSPAALDAWLNAIRASRALFLRDDRLF